MDLTGVLKDIQRDWKTNKFIISVVVEEKISQEMIEKIKDCRLSIILKRFRKKRTLDANAYCWVLCSKIAEVQDTSKDEVYEEMIQKYGYLYKDEEGYITITVAADVDMRKIKGHWKFYSGNENFSAYLMIKGSSEYSSAEMAKFLDMIILEAQELGIQTETPNRIAKMKALWGDAYGG